MLKRSSLIGHVIVAFVNVGVVLRDDDTFRKL